MSDWGCLLWSDIPNERVLRWTEDDGHVSVYQTDSGYANGHTRDNPSSRMCGSFSASSSCWTFSDASTSN